MFSGTAQVSHQVCQFFCQFCVSSCAWDYGGQNTNIFYDVYLLNELLETVVPFTDDIVVSADKLRELWDSVSELLSSLCDRRLEKTVMRPTLLPVKTAQFTQFFRQV